MGTLFQTKYIHVKYSSVRCIDEAWTIPFMSTSTPNDAKEQIDTREKRPFKILRRGDFRPAGIINYPQLKLAVYFFFFLIFQRPVLPTAFTAGQHVTYC